YRNEEAAARRAAGRAQPRGVSLGRKRRLPQSHGITLRREKRKKVAMTEKLILAPNPANNCFGCGGGNDFGMKLTFEVDRETGKASGKFLLGPRYGGGAGFVHGGVIAVLLDEVMGKISKLSEERAVTAELNIEYRKPVPTAAEIVVSGW